MTRVLATGTFDILHPGHIAYLEEAKTLGDELFVIVARDVNVKHKPKPVVPEDQRLRMVRALKIVDEAMLGSESDIFAPLLQIKPDIIALGYDQHFNEAWLVEELKKRGINPRVVRMKKFECELCSTARIFSRVVERHVKNMK